jgi:serine/threonine-protein kinase
VTKKPSFDEVDALIGSTIASYELQEAIGEGGMGRIYRARHTRLDRVVALKILPHERLADQTRRRRFLREAKTASSLDHPQIVTVHDLVEEDGRDFLVMELVEGGDLAAQIPSEGLPLDRALRWATQIASGLAAAHRAGVVHRDLKPSNVMLTAASDVKLVDFGLAKLVETDDAEAEAPTETALTRFGTLLGTVGYMSPEQAAGQPVDHRSDIFSFGSLLYEMLVGLRPFRGDTRVAVLHEIVYSEPDSLNLARADLPPGLVELVERCLRKNRDDRYSSMQRPLELLQGLSAMDTAAGPGSALGRTWRLGLRRAGQWARRRRSVLVWAAVAGAVALAVLPRGLELLTPALAGGISSPRSSTPYDHYRRGLEELERYDRSTGTDQAIEAFESAIALEGTHAPAHAGLALAYLEKYRIENDDPQWLQRATATARRAVDLDRHLAAAHSSLGLVLAESANEEAETALQRAIDLEPTNVEAHLGFAKLAGLDNRFEDQEAHLKRALEVAPERSRLHTALGTFFFGQARYEEAEAAFRRVVEVAPDNYIGYQSLGAVLHMLGRRDEAATSLQKALQIRPDANVYSNLGTLFYFDGRYREAAEAFAKAVELRPNRYLFWANLGDAYRWIPGAKTQAEESFARAIDLLRERLDAAPRDSSLRAALAEYLAKAGERDAAVEELAALDGLPEKSADDWFAILKAAEIAGERQRALEAAAEVLARGYSPDEIQSEPELLELRSDVRYHRLLMETVNP